MGNARIAKSKPNDEPEPEKLGKVEVTALKGNDSSQVTDFVDYLKADHKPALAALVGNAYRWELREGDVEFYFDHSHANLIPMLSMPRNHKQLVEGLGHFLGRQGTPYFRVGTDQRQENIRQRDAQALVEVKADPKVKFVLEKFNGTIMQCQILEKEQG